MYSVRLYSGLLLLAGLATVPFGLAADQREGGLVLRAVRFYRADQDRTRVKGLVQIPMALLQPAGLSHAASYTVSVRVADSTGLTLYQQSWQSRAEGSVDPEAYTVEIVDFALAPGKYRFEVAVKDSVSGRKLNTGTDLQALSDSSVASDLLIAPGIRPASSDDTVPRPGEFRTGNNLVTATARVVLTPLRTKVFYLLEAYAAQSGEGTLSISVRDSAGGTSLRTNAQPVKLNAGGSVLTGKLDLAGLPPGSYTMSAELRVAGRTIQRSAELAMANLAETLAKDTARRAAERITDEGYFAEMSDRELDQAEGPLEYIAEPSGLSSWNSRLSIAAKRRFLTTFWKERDPTPGTPRNERREAFYAAVEYANTAFNEGGRNPVPGWRSDRGRIYARNGAPDETYKRQQEGRAPRYEVWSYSKGRGNFYIFADRSGFGAFSLIHSSDLKETGLPGWADILGYTAVRDISQFLGRDLVATGRGP